jgi:hypothetical protein
MGTPSIFPVSFNASKSISFFLHNYLFFLLFVNRQAPYLHRECSGERTNREIRLRRRVLGVFPSVNPYLRLITAYLMEYTDDWANEHARSYGLYGVSPWLGELTWHKNGEIMMARTRTKLDLA